MLPHKTIERPGSFFLNENKTLKIMCKIITEVAHPPPEFKLKNFHLFGIAEKISTTL
jgi:hypothetical protein